MQQTVGDISSTGKGSCGNKIMNLNFLVGDGVYRKFQVECEITMVNRVGPTLLLLTFLVTPC